MTDDKIKLLVSASYHVNEDGSVTRTSGEYIEASAADVAKFLVEKLGMPTGATESGR